MYPASGDGMDRDFGAVWTEFTRSVATPLYPCATTSIAADSTRETVVAGYEDGRVVCMHSPSLEPMVSFTAHSQPVLSLHVDAEYIASLSPQSIRCHSRGGLPLLHAAIPGDLGAVSTFAGMNVGSPSLMVGGEGGLATFELERGLRTSSCASVRSVSCLSALGRALCCGSSEGTVSLVDPRIMERTSQLQLFAGTALAVDVSRDTVVCCGMRRNLSGEQYVEPFVKVLDARMGLRPVGSVPLQGYPVSISFHPQITSTALAVLQSGVVVSLDVQGDVALAASSAQYFSSEPLSDVVACAALAPSGAALVLGDAGGAVALWGDQRRADVPLVSLTGTPPDPVPPLPPPLRAQRPVGTDAGPLATYAVDGESALASQLDGVRAVRAPAPPRALPAIVRENMTVVEFVGYVDHPAAVASAQRFTHERHRFDDDAGASGKAFGARRGGDGGGGRDGTRSSGSGSGSGSGAKAGAAAARGPHTPPRPAGGSARDDLTTPSPFSREEKRRPGAARRSGGVPREFRFVDVERELLMLGFKDFDFGRYNRTSLSGLENGIPNAYCNVFLQFAYLVPQIRATALGHLCEEMPCLMCELGFLFHMMDSSPGSACQAANFLRALRHFRDAEALGLLDPLHSAARGGVRELDCARVEALFRFLLQQLVRATGGEDRSPLAPLVVSRLAQHKVFSSGEKETTSSTALAFDLRPPPAAERRPFAHLLRDALVRDTTIRAYNAARAAYQQTRLRAAPTELAPLLVLTCGGASHAAFWRSCLADINARHEFFPQHVHVRLENEDVSVRCLHSGDRVETALGHSSSSSSSAAAAGDDESGAPWLEYDLFAVVSLVEDATRDVGRRAHAVLHAGVLRTLEDQIAVARSTIRPPQPRGVDGATDAAPAAPPPDAPSDRFVWHLFNDFAVTPTTPTEARSFDVEWRTPSVLVLRRRGLDAELRVPSIAQRVGAEHLMQPRTLSPRKDLAAAAAAWSFVPLSSEEAPTRDSMYAIDCEFVALTEEEIDLLSDGTQVVSKPTRMGLGRVSVVRATGPRKGLPLIDDYIATTEPVADYLTRFSGLRPGDLDPKVSRHHVIDLKTAYLKLRYMVDTGCTFIGHGLRNDFRMINIKVPQGQIIDTVLIYNRPKARKIGLRFLIWYCFGEDIQAETHDSVEDARAALRLYEHHLELVRNGQWEHELDLLYRVGRSCNWQITGDVHALRESITSSTLDA